MSNQELPSLPGDVVDLLASARRIEGPADDVRARLRARLVSVNPIPPSGSSGSNRDGGGAVHSNPAAWARAPWWAVAAALLVGAGAGRLTADGAPTATTGVPLTHVSSAEARPIHEGAPAIDVSALANVVLPTAAGSGASPPATTLVGSRAIGDLAAERRLLEVARTALGRENGVDALAACDEHARRFPHGMLAEEREGIAVQALVESKRPSEARARGERFRQTYPKSILLPAVLAALEASP